MCVSDGFISGRRGSAERPCDRDLDQDRHLCRQDPQHQHQPGQVRGRMQSQLQEHLQSEVVPCVMCADCCSSSIKFTVGQGKEGIIDFTPGSELLVAKAKNGHLSVVSGPQQLLILKAASGQGKTPTPP